MKCISLISIIMALLVFQPGSPPSFAQQEVDEEYVLKAVFFERFSRFIEWPAEAGLDSPKVPFLIGVIGDHPFNTLLDELYATQSIKNKQVEIRYLTSSDEIEGCHILFIAKTDKKSLDKIVHQSKYFPVLTVADSMEYGRHGVHINMYMADEQIHFEINNKAASQSGIKISHLLLKVARPVQSSQGEQ
jgi:hypothetical protein